MVRGSDWTGPIRIETAAPEGPPQITLARTRSA
jgi:hypothetical protein